MLGQADAVWGAASGAAGDSITPRPPRIVFVSYGHADADDFARRLKRDLEERAGATVWLDLERIEGGADWAAAIELSLIHISEPTRPY